MDADDELLGHEAVHLGDILAVAGHAERDDVHEVVVVVDPCPLTELVRGLDRDRMEVERVGEQPGDIVVGPRVV